MLEESTMMKGNLCVCKCFIDVLYICDRVFKKIGKCAQSETDNFSVNFCHVLSRFYLWKRILTIQSVLRELLLTVNLWVLE